MDPLTILLIVLLLFVFIGLIGLGLSITARKLFNSRSVKFMVIEIAVFAAIGALFGAIRRSLWLRAFVAEHALKRGHYYHTEISCLNDDGAWDIHTLEKWIIKPAALWGHHELQDQGKITPELQALLDRLNQPGKRASVPAPTS